MRTYSDPREEPTVLRVVDPGMMLNSDVLEEIVLDLDGDGVDDVWVTLISSVTKSPLTGLETTTHLSVTASQGVAVGVSGPMQPGEAILRGDQFYRSVSLARFQGNARTEFFFGSWVRGPEDSAGILPVRLIGDNGVYLGFLAIELDGYGNVTRLSHAMPKEPMAKLKTPENAMDMAPVPMPTVEEIAPMGDDTPSTVPSDWRIAMN